MLGTMWINTGLAFLACIVTFGVAMVSNVWLVSLERAGFAFLLFFLAAFPIRWLMGTIIQPSEPALMDGDNSGVVAASPASALEGMEGTEDSDSEGEDSFTPLAFSRQDHTHIAEDPTTVAEVIRHLSDE